jgi:glycosyltransferase involved in cell wall biosynthesis
MPEISVIMGVYNELNKDILMEAVNSILHQTFEDFEFIIYDDGSCPEAATLLREVEGLDERIKLIGQDENHGLAFSLNACIDEAKGKYIARMDADDISYPERLMKQKKFLIFIFIQFCSCNDMKSIIRYSQFYSFHGSHFWHRAKFIQIYPYTMYLLNCSIFF